MIRGYRAEVDPAALGLPLTAAVRVRPAPGQLRNVAELAQRTAEVVACHRITGEDCFILEAHLRDVGHLEEVIDRIVAIGQTTTSIVQSSPVPRRAIASRAARARGSGIAVARVRRARRRLVRGTTASA